MQKYQIQYFNTKTSLITVSVINTMYKITAYTAKKNRCRNCVAILQMESIVVKLVQH